ncbi:transposable element Tcb1 transposase [Trichonephila clavipes]|nr:transposable element Tcb1 transposase [Trichonephila clavipes]
MAVGARLVVPSVSRIANIMDVSRTTVSRVMTDNTNLGKTTEHVFICRAPAEALHVDCLAPTLIHGGSSVMVLGAISSCELGHLFVLSGKITGDHYRSIITDHLHPMLQNLFLGKRPVVFQEDNAPVHMPCYFQTWLHVHDNEVVHLYITWCPQSPKLNINECL